MYSFRIPCWSNVTAITVFEVVTAGFLQIQVFGTLCRLLFVTLKKKSLKSSETWVLYVQVTVHRDKLRIKQPTRCTNIQHLFCHKSLHISSIFCAHHQELSTVRTAIGTFYEGCATTS